VAETEKQVLSKLFRLVPIFSVVIAMTALLTTVAARRKGLTCTYLGSSHLVSVGSGGLEKTVKVEIAGQTVTSISKMSFAVKNTGALAIRSEDVKEPIGLYFPKNVKLINAVVDGTSPPGFSFKVNLDASQNVVFCEFPLLNSGDEAYLAVYIYDSPEAIPELKGRVVDLKAISNTDESGKQLQNPFPYLASIAARKVIYLMLLIFNILLCASIIMILAKLALEYIHWRGWLRQWGDTYELAVLESHPELKPEYDRGRRIGRHKTPKLFNTLSVQQLTQKGIPKNPNTADFSPRLYFGFAVFLMFLAALFGLTSSFMYFAPKGF
jgi:hypothetical protein